MTVIHVSAPACQADKQDAGGRVLIVIMSLFAYHFPPTRCPGPYRHPKR